jgi:hypothetical protein
MGKDNADEVVRHSAAEAQAGGRYQRGGVLTEVKLMKDIYETKMPAALEIKSRNYTHVTISFDKKLTLFYPPGGLNNDVPSGTAAEARGPDRFTPKEYGQLAMLAAMAARMNVVLTQLNELRNDPKFKLTSTEFTSEFKNMWENTFRQRKTDFYERVLSNPVYKEDALVSTSTVAFGDDYKVIINVGDDISSPSTIPGFTKLDKIVEDTENTFVYLACTNFMIIKYIVAQLALTHGVQTPEFTVLLNTVRELGRNLKKSSISTFKSFEEEYDNKLQLGGGPRGYTLDEKDWEYLLQMVKNPLPSGGTFEMMINATQLLLYKEFGEVLARKTFDPSKILVDVNKNIVDKAGKFKEQLGELYNLIQNMLGEANKPFGSLADQQAADGSGAVSFGDLLVKIEEAEKRAASAAADPTMVGGSNRIDSLRVITFRQPFQLGGGNQPRMDKYVDQLKKCISDIAKTSPLLSEYNRLLREFEHGKLNDGDQESFLKVYEKFKMIIDNGRNSYIKVIPMIFFITEFPPRIYLDKKPDSFYKFSFDGATQEVKRILMDRGVEKDPKLFKEAHAAFFESNGKNHTSDLLGDPLIGLDKILAAGSDSKNPTNSVINMMFALGASGTGKTTRYFGGDKTDPKTDPKDIEGIASFIVKNATSTGASPDVDIAYFVCYGQKYDTGFGEYVIFFNIDRKDASGAQIKMDDIDPDQKYIPYHMPPPSSPIKTGEKYSKFYSELTNRRLQKLKYSDIKNVLNGDVDGTTIKSSLSDQPSTFRQIVGDENNKDIWMSKNAGSIQEVTALFENLLKQQKKIYTVLPTKNNIESSRGHTCVLFRFKYRDGTYKYFPLFDMAGTEDPAKVQDFFTKYTYSSQIENKEAQKYNDYYVKKPEMARLLHYINNAGESTSIDEKGEQKIQSLNMLLEQSEVARKYVLSKDQSGGAKYVGTLIDQGDTSSSKPAIGAKFLQKIVNEGFYINHTIATLIFATLCVGESINAKIENGEDKFDDISKPVMEGNSSKLGQNKICFLDAAKQANCTDTKFLVKDWTLDAIVNNSCIWAQILFSFLYWNKESKESANNLVTDMNSLGKDMSPYINEVCTENPNFELLNGMTLETIKSFDVKVLPAVIKYFEFLKANGAKLINIGPDHIKIELGGEIYKVDSNGEIIKDDDGISGDQPTVQLNNVVMQGSTVITKSDDRSAIEDSVGNMLCLFKNINFKKTYEKIISSGSISTLKDAKAKPVPGQDEQKPKTARELELEALRAEGKASAGINKAKSLGQKCEMGNILSGEAETLFSDARSAQYYNAGMSSDAVGLLVMLSMKAGGITCDTKVRQCLTEYDKAERHANKYIKLLQSIVGVTSYDNIKKIFESNDQTVINSINDKIKIYVQNNSKTKEFSTKHKTNVTPEVIKCLVNMKITDEKRFKEVSEALENFKGKFTAGVSDPVDNQIRRVKDGRTFATKMTLMHLVTGENYKYEMVNNTLELCKLLFSATSLDIQKK